MNIKKAKEIPIEKLVIILGGRFSHNGKPGEEWYFSPFRPDERTASFRINTKTNQWHDFARTEGVDAHGDILDLWTDFNNRQRKDGSAIKDALSYLKMLSLETVSAVVPRTKTISQNQRTAPRYEFVKSPGAIWLPELKNEISRRGLSLAIIQPHLKHAFIRDTKTQKKYNGFAFQNLKQGYDISIPHPSGGNAFKTTIGSKGITVIGNGQFDKAIVFEGFWDLFTFVRMRNGFENFCYISLNSTANAKHGLDYLINQKHTIHSVFSFLDNDNAGERATSILALGLEPLGFTFGTMNHHYINYKDLNEYWMDTFKSKPESTLAKNSINNRTFCSPLDLK